MGTLVKDAQTGATRLEDGQEGLGGGSGGSDVLSAAAQEKVYASWHRYLGQLRGRCSRLEQVLIRTSGHHYGSDLEVQARVNLLALSHEDTKATGGEGRSR